MTRRTVLALLGGGFALVAGGTVLRLSSGYTPPPDAVPIGLDAKRFVIVAALVEAMFPADGELPAGAALGVAQQVDGEVWAMSDAQRSSFRTALSAIELAPLLLGWGGRLTHLAPAERVAALDALAATGPRLLAQGAIGVKQLLHLVYYGSPETWAALGYDGPHGGGPARPPASGVAYAALLRSAR